MTKRIGDVSAQRVGGWCKPTGDYPQIYDFRAGDSSRVHGVHRGRVSRRRGVSAQGLPEWTVYLFGGYAAYRVIASVVNFVRATTKDDLAVRAVKYINLAAALVSVFTLQTAIFNAFFTSYDPIIFNALSGFSVCFIMLVLGVYIISFSSIVRKNIKAQQVKMEAEAQAENLYNREGYDEEYGANAVSIEEQESEECLVIEGSVGEVVEVVETTIE